MNKTIHQAKLIRKRKMLLLLPCMIIPFITLAFYALGGGQAGITANENEEFTGLNSTLPEAKDRNKQLLDKLGIYNQAQRDSIKRSELIRSDPYYKHERGDNLPFPPQELDMASEKHGRLYPSTSPIRESEIETKVMERLSLIEQEMNRPASTYQLPSHHMDRLPSAQINADLQQLEGMMALMSTKDAVDPEMVKLENTLDKILDIQHPERVKQRFQNHPDSISKATYYPVSSEPADVNSKQGFFPIHLTTKVSEAGIKAVVHDNQLLVNGSIIKLRLLTNMYIQDQLIPKGHFLFGNCKLNGERLKITISSIRYSNQLFPVKLSIYDLDGMEGIFVPGSIISEMAGATTAQTLPMPDIQLLDQSLKSQATSAGLQTARSFLNKKTKLVKVQVKAGYEVIINN